MTEPVNILLVGFGPHSRKTFYPVFEKYGSTWGFKIACVVDLKQKEVEIESFFSTKSDSPDLYFVDSESVGAKSLNPADQGNLDSIVMKCRIKGVVISTEPTSHMLYARWALDRGLSVLIEKPLSTRQNASTRIGEARGLLEDYEELLRLYNKARSQAPSLVVSVMAQRRYHSAFLKMQELLGEVFQRTGCPVTALQIYHADGQWRMPHEIIDIEYHGFNRGFGALSHSGYHVFDVAPLLVKAAEGDDSESDSIEVVSTFVRPYDLVAQLNYDRYSHLFPEFQQQCSYSEAQYSARTRSFGEIDAFVSLTLKRKTQVQTHMSISLLHNSFSKRGWLSSRGRELAKGNGRIGHETYQIVQGPFQTIYYETYRNGEMHGTHSDSFGICGELHVDIHVFRNNSIFADWPACQHFNGADLKLDFPRGDFPGGHEAARRKCLREFVDYLQGKVPRKYLKSELPSHRKGVALISAAYESAIRRELEGNPLIHISLDPNSS